MAAAAESSFKVLDMDIDVPEPPTVFSDFFCGCENGEKCVNKVPILRRKDVSFHIKDTKEEFEASLPGLRGNFTLQHAFQVVNERQYHDFEREKQTLEANGQDPNVDQFFCIVPQQLVVRFLEDKIVPYKKGGPFGNAIYFGSLEKTLESISITKGHVCVFLCDVIQGKKFVFPDGAVAPHLQSPPPSFQSVEGYFSPGSMIAVYNPNHILIHRFLVFHNSQPLPQVDIAKCPADGNSMDLTGLLNLWIDEVVKRASVKSPSHAEFVKLHITKWLQRQIPASVLISTLSSVLQIQFDHDMVQKLEILLSKSTY